MSTFVVGDVLEEKYEIKAILGAGGMGTVYRARQIDLGRDVAIKVPNPQALEVPGFLARFSREARLVARLVHDNIVQVYEYHEEEQNVYIVMEYVEGQDLKAMIGRPPSNLTVRDLAVILRASCEGLAHAHEGGIVHRDIKPHNIMVQPRARGKWRVKIMDFGIAHLDANTQMTMMQGEQLTVTGQAIGTPTYMSPEQIRGTGVTPCSDIYSFGCVTFFAFTRQTPFMGTGFTVAASHLSDSPPPLRSKVPKLPPELEEIVNRTLAKDPADRPQDASDLGQEIYDALKPIFDTPMKEIWPGEVSGPSATAIPSGPIDSSGATIAETAGLPEDKQPIASPTFVAAAGAETISEQPTISDNAVKRPKPDEGTDATLSKLGSTRTSPSAVSDKTVPYGEPAAASVEAAPQRTPMSTSKLLLIIAAVLVPLMVIGIGAGLAFRNLAGGGGGEPDGPDPDPTEIAVNGQPTPTPTPTPTPIPDPTDQVVVEPSPEKLVPTPTEIPGTPSPTPAPTPDPIEQRIATWKERFEAAETHPARILAWKRAMYDPEFGDTQEIRDLAKDFARQIALDPPMARVNEGRFTMGSSSAQAFPEEKPAHNVSLSAYSIGIYEVTALEFSCFLNSITPSDAQKLYKPDGDTNIVFDQERSMWLPAEDRELHPANAVTWEAAVRYADWLSDETSELYRLPTEAEWERAAADGADYRYPWGNAEPDASQAQFNASGTVPVNEKGPSTNLGLYNMAGNVAEWCLDWYAEDSYQLPDRMNPMGPVSPPDGSRSRRVMRGGSFQIPSAIDLRITRRDRLQPDRDQPDVGFRLVREAK